MCSPFFGPPKKEMQAEGPEGLCETELKVAVDGKTLWSPDMTVKVWENGDTWPPGGFHSLVLGPKP